MLTHRERLLATLRFERPDRVALLGGWMIDDAHQQAVAGCTPEQYWQDPVRWAIAADRALGVDGMIAVHTPRQPGDYRDGLTKDKFESYKGRYRSPEDVVAFVRSRGTPHEFAARYPVEAWADSIRTSVRDLQARMGDIVYLPTLWDQVHPTFEWYWEFGYENYLMFLQLYPEAANQLFAQDGAVCRRRSVLAVGLFRELGLVPLTLIGTDICGKNGPVASPRLLREAYFPHVRSALEPVVEAGIRTVWHSDGLITPIVDDILACGVSGLQGFQEEYGVDIASLARKRTRDGEKLTLFAGPSSAAALAHGSVDDVRRGIARIVDTLAGECALFILPGNNILPDAPVENVIAMYRHAAEHSRGLG